MQARKVTATTTLASSSLVARFSKACVLRVASASLLVSFLASVFASIAHSQSIDIGNFYYRDFLDFGQNKGAFQIGAQNVVLQGKDGTEFAFPNASANALNQASIPDFSAKSNFGSFTAIGGSYAVTANHIRSIENQAGWRKWGQTTYEVAGKLLGQGLDSQFLRFNRFIVEGEAELLETGITNHTTSHDIIKQPGTAAYNSQVALEQANIAILEKRLEEIKQANGGTLYAYGAGSGLLSLQVGRDYLASDLPMTDDGRLGGVLSTLSFVKGYSSFANLTSVGENEVTDGRGLNIQLGVNQTFKNTITMGDSGGAFYIYDSTKGKWVVLGVVSGTEGPNNTRLSFAAQADFEKLKNTHTQSINLGNGSYTLMSNYITKNSGSGDNSKTIYDNKDIEFSGGGSVKFGSLIKGQNIGFIFKDEANATTYDFTSNNIHLGYEGLGLDVGKNVEVNWSLKNEGRGQNEALHKIGEGTLIVKTNYTPTGNNALGYMRLGEGKVVLDTSTKAYDGIYITSGRGTLALVEGKAEALGAVKQSAGGSGGNSYTLAQDSVSALGFYFGNNGGKLDLGGNSLSLNVISANDAKAVITNSATTASNFSIEGYSYDKSGNKTTTKADYIAHASFEGNLNLIQKNAIKGDESLVFDGNIDIQGKLESENANIVLQGHPTTHAVVDDKVLAQVKAAEEKTGYKLPAWMDLSRPSTLQQPDWDKRTFKIAGGIDLKNSTFTLGRSASLESNITADANSRLNFGGKVNHFIDKSDGSNTRGNGFNFYQEVSKGVLENEANDTISYKGKITANGTVIESGIHDFNASLDLSAGASLKASYLTLSSSQNSIKLSGASSASVDHLIISGLNTISGLSVDSSSKFEVKQSFIFDNTSGFNLSALDSAGFTSQPSNYDLIARNSSSINGTSKDLIANVALIGGSSATLKSLTLKDTNASGQSEAGKLKNEVILSGEGTKLTLNENLTAQDLAGALIQINDKANLNITNDMIFSFSGARPSKNDKPNALDSNQAYIFVSGGASASMQNLNATNMNINLSVDKDSTFGAQKIIGNNSAFSVALGSMQSFGIELSGGEMSLQAAIDSRTLDSTALDSGARADSSALAGAQATQESLQKAYENITLTGDITASQNAKIESNLASITGNIALSDTASLNLNSGVLNLDSAHNTITLKDTASLSAQRIYAKSLSSLALNIDSSARLNVSELVFDSSSVQVAHYFGENLYAQNASTLKQTEQNLAQNLYLSGGSSFEGLYKSPLDVSVKTITISGNTGNKDNERYITLTQGSKLIANNLEATNIKRLNIALDSASHLEIDKLNANNASVYLSFNVASKSALESNQSAPKANASTTSNAHSFDIDASNNSHIFINSWNLNGVNQGNASNTGGINGAIDSGITSDDSSRVHFGSLQITQREISAQAINGAFSIDGNVAISGLLSLEGLGKIDSAMPFNLGLFDDISATPTNSTAANSASTNSLSAQTTASLNRFLALQVEKTLALESDARISVSIDSSFDKNNIKLNHYYTLAKAQGGIDDERLDKRIDFIFSDASDKLYTTTIVENGEIKVSFTKDDPKSLAELSKHNERADILEALLTHNPNDDTIDRAARTNDYALLGAYVSAIDSDMASIARINQQAFSEQILLTNNEAINTRILQASINQARAMSALQKRVRLADTSDKALKERLDEVAQAQKELARKNSVWLNVGGGYFKQSTADSHNAIYGTNIGYDRFFATRGADILLGGMLGVNGANAMAKTHKDTTKIYNAGLYLSIRARQNEIQTNLNGLILDTERSFGGTFGEENIDSTTGAMLFSVYYKYAFRLGRGGISADFHALDSGALDSGADSVGISNASDLGDSASHFAHILKPVGQLSFAYNGGGGFRSQNFRQQSINDMYLALGVGGEYVLSGKDASYALQILARATLFHTQDKILVTLSNANNFISYDLRHAPVNFALNFMGQNALTSTLSLSYGLSALIDSSASFGLKGDVKLEYRF